MYGYERELIRTPTENQTKATVALSCIVSQFTITKNSLRISPRRSPLFKTNLLQSPQGNTFTQMPLFFVVQTTIEYQRFLANLWLEISLRR